MASRRAASCWYTRGVAVLIGAALTAWLFAAADRALADENAATIEQRWYVPPSPSVTEPKRVRTITIRGDDDPVDTGSVEARTDEADADAPLPPGYFVQVASRPTRAEVLASYRALQVRFSFPLGGREPAIRRVDLGKDYAALVGPFADADEANALCVRLRTRDGQCIVQKS